MQISKPRWILHELIQKNVACSYGYKSGCADDKISKYFKLYLGKYAVYNFRNNMIEESQYCTDVLKKHFNKEVVMTKMIMNILGTMLNAGLGMMIMFNTML